MPLGSDWEQHVQTVDCIAHSFIEIFAKIKIQAPFSGVAHTCSCLLTTPNARKNCTPPPHMDSVHLERRFCATMRRPLKRPCPQPPHPRRGPPIKGPLALRAPCGPPCGGLWAGLWALSVLFVRRAAQYVWRRCAETTEPSKDPVHHPLHPHAGGLGGQGT